MNKINKKRILCSYGVHVDAVAGWIGSYGGENSICDISRGIFAGEIGVPRLLKLFKKYNIYATWFIPGHSIESFPDEMKSIVKAGHEVALHGYSHENPTKLTIKQQKEILDYTYNLHTNFFGTKPKGYVAPWWEITKESLELLLKYEIEYDNSMMHHDCQPYYLRSGDKWYPINYSLPASTWMKPLERGDITKMVEIPANWYLDDLPPMMFIKNLPNSHGFINPRDIEQLWKDQFDYYYREYDNFIFPITIHPDVSGRPQVILMHERIIEYINSHEGIEWVTMEKICDEFKKKQN
jgi:peptidoglycan/xylan/chitin deacetylase (PgdA/CDA1 family)